MQLLKNIRWYLKRKRRKANSKNDGHSQYGQDVTVYELLGKPQTGFFLDIGANDGKTFSNSLLFEENGWEGICVEPHPEMFKTLEAHRKCHLINACVSDTDGTVNFMMIEGPENMLSGIVDFFDDHHMERIDKGLKTNGGSKKIIEIEALTPATILERFNAEQIDFLSVDVEGCDLNIIQAFDFAKTRVHMISVENNRSPSIMHFLDTKGFDLIKCVGCDEIYRNRSF